MALTFSIRNVRLIALGFLAVSLASLGAALLDNDAMRILGCFAVVLIMTENARRPEILLERMPPRRDFEDLPGIDNLDRVLVYGAIACAGSWLLLHLLQLLR